MEMFHKSVNGEQRIGQTKFLEVIHFCVSQTDVEVDLFRTEQTYNTALNKNAEGDDTGGERRWACSYSTVFYMLLYEETEA